MAYSLSDNAKEVLLKLIAAALIVIPLMIQSSNQHAERVANERRATEENNAGLKAVAAEVKASARPLVFGEPIPSRKTEFPGDK